MYCKFCGEPLQEPVGRHCPHCGSFLNKKKRRLQVKSTLKFLIITIVGLALLLSSAYISFSLTSVNPSFTPNASVQEK